ncbi:MAG: chorismate-binding protein [Fibrobacteres bacterium]|nr:chorismate-binding protein [Fibrobacterota bacterium]
MKFLLLDNYDSFSHLLFQYLWEAAGEEPLFVRNDEWTLARLREEAWDALVISPGPGHPADRRDFGICGEALRADLGKPVLGICLGLQGLGLAAGASIVPAPAPRHGKPSRIQHNGQGLFAGLPQGFSATRYHSLAIDPATVGPELIVTATAEDDGQIMGARLAGRPAFGVQFHPESIGTEHGKALIANFRDLARASLRIEDGVLGANRPGSVTSTPASATPRTASANPLSASAETLPAPFASAPIVLEARALPWRDPEAAFARWFRQAPAAFWLDSLSEPVPGEARMTYMGSGAALFEAKGGHCRSYAAEGSADSQRGASSRTPDTDSFPVADPFPDADPFVFLETAMRDQVACKLPEALSFPGNFRGGLVGYFGYGLKRFAGSGGPLDAVDADLPDALFVRPDRMLAFDPAGRRAWAFLPCGPEGPTAEARAWLDRVEKEWESFSLPDLALVTDPDFLPASPGSLEGFRLPWRPSLPREDYLERVRLLQAAILRGESYEACLTNELRAECAADAFEVYRCLRRINPAPYAAFLRFPGHDVICASPERFLKLDAEGRLECRPIKGTRPRGVDPASDAAWRDELASHPKDRSENLMIVDLMRNDFSKVCALGTVAAPDLMRVEPHPSVWQLVSTVTGRLAPGRGAPGLGALDAVRACFPAGSMTGAPKKRTMELLESAEGRARGIFSGAFGYLGGDGAMDLGMVIRTLIRVGGEYRIGCGGAILAESDPAAEWAEALLKAAAPMQALEIAAFGAAGGWKTRSG